MCWCVGRVCGLTARTPGRHALRHTRPRRGFDFVTAVKRASATPRGGSFTIRRAEASHAYRAVLVVSPPQRTPPIALGTLTHTAPTPPAHVQMPPNARAVPQTTACAKQKTVHRASTVQFTARAPYFTAQPAGQPSWQYACTRAWSLHTTQDSVCVWCAERETRRNDECC